MLLKDHESNVHPSGGMAKFWEETCTKAEALLRTIQKDVKDLTQLISIDDIEKVRYNISEVRAFLKSVRDR